MFDKHDKPNLSIMTAEAAWAACDEFEDYVYNVAESFSEGEWGCMIEDVSTLRDEYYTLFEN